MDDEKILIEADQSEEQDQPLTKEEILERSREENSRGDERTKNAMLKAGYLAMLTGGLLCTGLYLLYDFLLHEIRYELFFVYTVMSAVFMGVQFYYTRKKSHLVGASAFAVASIGFIIILIIQLAGII